MFKQLHHVQLAMPAGGEARARAYCGGVLAWSRFPRRRYWRCPVVPGSARTVSRYTWVSTLPSCLRVRHIRGYSWMISIDSRLG